MGEYYDSVYNANEGSLRRMFHEKAVMFGFFGQIFLSGTPEPFFRGIASEPSAASIGTQCSTIFADLNIQENSADALVYVNGFYGDTTVEDHFNLIKENGRWKIICKIINVLK